MNIHSHAHVHASRHHAVASSAGAKSAANVNPSVMTDASPPPSVDTVTFSAAAIRANNAANGK